MLHSIRCVLARVAAAFVLVLVCSQATPVCAQLTLEDYAYPVSGWVQTYDPHSTGNDWDVRKAIADFLDLVMDTVDIESHPLLHPDLGPFISKFHQARWWEAINTLANVPPPVTGVRSLKLYSSSWIIQAKDGNGSFNVGIDVCDGPFGPSTYTPFNHQVSNAQIQAMADLLDVYFITHIHGDHLSARLIYEMLLRGKPIIATQEVKNEAMLLGAPNAASITVPSGGSTHTLGPLTWTSFDGWQYGGFLDAAQTIPDVNHPFNVTNNSFLFSLNGKDIVHFGDNNDPGITSFLQTKLNQGWSPDLQMNMGQLQPTLEPMISPEQRFLSHDLEFHHFGDSFLSMEVHQSGPNIQRRVLMWGEHLDTP